jgi:hypothetical protein
MKGGDITKSNFIWTAYHASPTLFKKFSADYIVEFGFHFAQEIGQAIQRLRPYFGGLWAKDDITVISKKESKFDVGFLYACQLNVKKVWDKGSDLGQWGNIDEWNDHLDSYAGDGEWLTKVKKNPEKYADEYDVKQIIEDIDSGKEFMAWFNSKELEEIRAVPENKYQINTLRQKLLDHNINCIQYENNFEDYDVPIRATDTASYIILDPKDIKILKTYKVLFDKEVEREDDLPIRLEEI